MQKKITSKKTAEMRNHKTIQLKDTRATVEEAVAKIVYA